MTDERNWIEFWLHWQNGSVPPDILVVVPVESEKPWFAIWEGDEIIREEESYVEVLNYLQAQHYQLIRRMDRPRLLIGERTAGKMPGQLDTWVNDLGIAIRQD